MADYAVKAIRRREDPRLLTGTGEFIDDRRVPGCLHVAILRTPHAHAWVRAIDAVAARSAPGVIGVFTGHDLGRVNAAMPAYAPHPALPIVCGTRPLATDRVRFVGEAVVAVVATDRYLAADALDRITVDYVPLPAVADVEAALASGAAQLHEELPGNIAGEWSQCVGDAKRGRAGRLGKVQWVVVASGNGQANQALHPEKPGELPEETLGNLELESGMNGVASS